MQESSFCMVQRIPEWQRRCNELQVGNLEHQHWMIQHVMSGQVLSTRTDAQKYAKVHQNPTFYQ